MINLQKVIGLGVAGNFTGHLEQAGEASDFVGVTAAAGAPKGVFPFYVPQAEGCGAEAQRRRQSPGSAAPETAPHFLHTFPLSTDTIAHPGRINGQPANLQIEPELALLCELQYDDTHHVTAIHATHVAAYNDCSTRRPDATKISQKKNWGTNTKGLASDQWLALDAFTDAGVLKNIRLACYLLRDGELHAYGEDSPVSGYGYMYDQLLAWLVDRLNTQHDHGPLENLAEWLRVAGYPSHAVVSIGATRYTPLGESTFLEPGDESIVVAYDATAHDRRKLEAMLLAEEKTPGAGQTCSVLRQRVVGDV